MRRNRGFTLTEMLVVVGILVVLVSLLMPAVMKARRAGRQAACSSNLRQVGHMLLMYAESHNDLIPLGLTAIPKAGTTDPLSPDAEWDTTPVWTCYLVVGGAPSANLGALLGARMISGENAKMLYCPNDLDERLVWSRWRDKYPPRGGDMPVNVTIRCSYFVRPIAGNFRHTLLPRPQPQVLWPGEIIPRYDDLRNKAIVAERMSHGNAGDPRLNVLFQDGSVRYLAMPRPDSGGGSGEAPYTTPDHLPPRPDSEDLIDNAARHVITIFDWGDFDRQ